MLSWTLETIYVVCLSGLIRYIKRYFLHCIFELVYFSILGTCIQLTCSDDVPTTLLLLSLTECVLIILLLLVTYSIRPDQLSVGTSKHGCY